MLRGLLSLSNTEVSIDEQAKKIFLSSTEPIQNVIYFVSILVYLSIQKTDAIAIEIVNDKSKVMGTLACSSEENFEAICQEMDRLIV